MFNEYEEYIIKNLHHIKLVNVVVVLSVSFLVNPTVVLVGGVVLVASVDDTTDWLVLLLLLLLLFVVKWTLLEFCWRTFCMKSYNSTVELI